MRNLLALKDLDHPVGIDHTDDTDDLSEENIAYFLFSMLVINGVHTPPKRPFFNNKTRSKRRAYALGRTD